MDDKLLIVEIEKLIKLLNTYVVNFIRLEQLNGDYCIIRDDGEVLFSGSLKGCMDYLQDYKLQLYDYCSTFSYLIDR